MRVYILTREPYHDNSTIIGVFKDRDTALSSLKAAPTADFNDDDFMITEWDIELGVSVSVWRMTGVRDYANNTIKFTLSAMSIGQVNEPC